MRYAKAVLVGVSYFAQILAAAMVIHFAVNWLLPVKHPVRAFVSRVLRPLLDPLRRFLDAHLHGPIKKALVRLPIDISPLLALLILSALRAALLFIAGLL